MTPTYEYQRGSVERVDGCITDDNGNTIPDAATIQVSIHRQGDGYSWKAASWSSAAGVSRKFHTTAPVDFSTANFPRSTYEVVAKVSIGDEAPIIQLGFIKIT